MTVGYMLKDISCSETKEEKNIDRKKNKILQFSFGGTFKHENFHTYKSFYIQSLQVWSALQDSFEI